MLRILFSVIILLSSALSFAKSSVWEISDGSHSIVIGGTIHLLRDSDYPLPNEFEHAYKNSTTLIMETDIHAITNDPSYSLQLMQIMVLPGKQTLESTLDKKTWNSLKTFSHKHAMPLDQWLKFKPAMVSMLMSMHQIQQLNFQVNQGVEMYFSRQALQDKKSLMYLETIEEQLSFMNSLNRGDANVAIKQAMNEVDSLPKTMNQMTQAWREGDVKTFTEVGLKPIMTSPETYQNLLVKRNKSWLPKITELFNNKTAALVLVGSLHLIGPDSVLAMLKQAGYQVKPYEISDLKRRPAKRVARN